MLDEVAVNSMVNRHERWREVRLTFPEVSPGDRPVIRVGLKFLEKTAADRRISNGTVTARRGLWIDKHSQDNDG